MTTYLIVALLFFCMVVVTTYSLVKKNELEGSLAALVAEAEKRQVEYSTEIEAANRKVARHERFWKSELERRLAVLVAEAEKRQVEYSAELEAANREVAKLERFRHIPDIIEKANRTKEQIAVKLEDAQRRSEQILQLANEEATEVVMRATVEAEAIEQRARHAMSLARSEADVYAEAARRETEEELAGARRKVKEELKRADTVMANAIVEAVEIRERAEKKATEIAGKAYDAVQRKEFYESAAEAMRNVTRGYGDRYMVSGMTTLDDWAEEYGFDQAGERLRLARERVKIMERNRTAATCDYVEALRREMAMSFVLDAFNGKVESILSRVKHDNYGKLRQEIRDVFSLVNFNGKAFKDARITEEFLEARCDELKWAEAVQQLRLLEKEEQRAIKEQIREEEKARREYEKAIKQAQRDEDLLSKAIEKTREEYANANAEDRAEYESKLHDLAEKLRAAEEKNQRAISMAQQTKCGHVYVISNVGSFGENVYKIGLTRRLEPLDRVRELGDASVPFAFDVHALIYSEDAPALEAALHRKFLQSQVNKVNRRKEFFRLKLQDIRNAIDPMDQEVKWTIAAEAKDYRETLAMERQMEEDPEYRARWSEEQAANESRFAFDEESDEAAEDDVDVFRVKSGFSLESQV